MSILVVHITALFTSSLTNQHIDLTIVTTADGSKPTHDKSSPLNGMDGRGLIILFNQALLFQLAELGSTVAQAKSEGMSTACDNGE